MDVAAVSKISQYAGTTTSFFNDCYHMWVKILGQSKAKALETNGHYISAFSFSITALKEVHIGLAGTLHGEGRHCGGERLSSSSRAYSEGGGGRRDRSSGGRFPRLMPIRNPLQR